MFVFFFSVFEKDQLTTLCKKKQLVNLDPTLKIYRDLGGVPKSREIFQTMLCDERQVYSPTPISHNKQTLIKMTNLLILRLSSVVEEFLLTG